MADEQGNASSFGEGLFFLSPADLNDSFGSPFLRERFKQSEVDYKGPIQFGWQIKSQKLPMDSGGNPVSKLLTIWQMNEVKEALDRIREPILFNSHLEFLEKTGLINLAKEFNLGSTQDGFALYLSEIKEVAIHHPNFKLNVAFKVGSDQGVSISTDSSAINERYYQAGKAILEKEFYPPISLYIHPGDASAEDVSEFYMALNVLYRSIGGAGLRFVNEGQKTVVRELA